MVQVDAALNPFKIKVGKFVANFKVSVVVGIAVFYFKNCDFEIESDCYIGSPYPELRNLRVVDIIGYLAMAGILACQPFRFKPLKLNNSFRANCSGKMPLSLLAATI